MARTVIPTNFQDDELAEEMQGRRRYRQILNPDGTVSFVDVTDYNTEGSTFGASRVNEMAQNINESADVNKIIDDLEDIAVVTQNGFMAGALSVKELNNNLTANSNSFIFDYHDGVYGWNESSARGADTFHPFSGLIDLGTGTAFDIKSIYPNYNQLTVDNFIIEPISGCSADIGYTHIQGKDGQAAVWASCAIAKSYSNGVLSAKLNISSTMAISTTGYFYGNGSANVHAYLKLN